MKILGIYDNSGPKYHRVYLPLALMDVEYSLADTITDENAKVDIVFFNRAIAKQSINSVMEFKKKYGFKLVVDFDDHWRLDRSHILYDYYYRAQVSEIMEEYLKISEAVFCTHERLESEIKKFNRNCFIFPNAIPKVAQFLYKKQPDKEVRLFWAGGITHRRDIEILREPVKRISRPGVKFIMAGYHNEKEWRAMASTFTNGGKLKHELIESLPVKDYYGHYAKSDICFVPLVENSFNIYKSNLKILEAANIGSPVIVSKVHPYLGFPEEIVNYVSTQRDWFTHADYLIKNKAVREIQGAMLKEYCEKNYNFEKINHKRKQVLLSVAGV